MSVRLHRHRSTSTGKKLLHLSGLLAVVVACFAVHPAGALAVTCPNGNPIVNENNCMGAGTTAYDMTKYDDNIGGFSVQTSYNLGQSVQLKIGRNLSGLPTSKANIDVYRLGDYGGTGARRIAAASATNVTVNNNQTCNAMDPVTGKLDCGNWAVTYTIPGSSLPATGVYEAKLTATDNGIQNTIIFVVRDDNRSVPSKGLYVVSTASYQAYNTWGGKSLYFDKDGGITTVAGDQRAVKVSFNRPLDNADASRNRFFGPDQNMVEWLERQGYDISYTDDVAVSQNPNSLKVHKSILVPGHSEYWSLEEMHGFKAARDAGVNIASFSSNTGYWKVRYEDGGRTLVCYKTVQGTGATGDGVSTPNDWGPDGVKGTADDALGADGIAGTADDHPENSTTTWRDNGAPNGDPNAPPGGRVGPNEPENSLWGNMYVGDNEVKMWALGVPAANANGEFAADRIWRNTGISQNVTTNLGDANVVGWEWDADPDAGAVPGLPAGRRQAADPDRRPPTPTTAGSSTRAACATRSRRRASRRPRAPSSTARPAARGSSPPAPTSGRSGSTTTASRRRRTTSSPTGRHSRSRRTRRRPGPGGLQLAADRVVHGHAATRRKHQHGRHLQRLGLERHRRHRRQVRVGPRRRRHLRDQHRHHLERHQDLHHRGHLRRASQGHRQRWRHRLHHAHADHCRQRGRRWRRSPRRPTRPWSARTCHFDASSSSDSDNTIVKYEWDLDGNGTFETNTGTTKTVDKAYATTGHLQRRPARHRQRNAGQDRRRRRCP